MRSKRARPRLATSSGELVLRTVLQHGPLARVALAHHTGLTPAAISNITRGLIDRGMLRIAGRQRGEGAGADAILLDLPGDAPLVGVVHQGVSALRIGLCTLRGHLVGRREIRTPQPYAPVWAADTIAHTLRHLLYETEHDAADLLAVGAGLVGLIDAERGVVKRAPSFGWQDVPLGQLVAERLGVPVAVDNNVRAMAAGEALLGEGRHWADFALVYVGIGIGAGLIINGEAYRGAYGGAGEIGHISVAEQGAVCSCGNRGCLETVAAEPAIVRRARDLGIALPLGADDGASGVKDAMRALAARARAGDEAALGIVRASGSSLGAALASLVNLVNPTRIVLHGTITQAGPTFLEAAAQALRERAFLASSDAIELVLPTFGEDAGLVGAAALALHGLVFPLAGRPRAEQLALQR